MKSQTFNKWFATRKPEFQERMRELKLVWTLRQCFASGKLSGANVGVEYARNEISKAISGLRLSSLDAACLAIPEESK